MGRRRQRDAVSGGATGKAVPNGRRGTFPSRAARRPTRSAAPGRPWLLAFRQAALYRCRSEVVRNVGRNPVPPGPVADPCRFFRPPPAGGRRGLSAGPLYEPPTTSGPAGGFQHPRRDPGTPGATARVHLLWRGPRPFAKHWFSTRPIRSARPTSAPPAAGTTADGRRGWFRNTWTPGCGSIRRRKGRTAGGRNAEADRLQDQLWRGPSPRGKATRGR